MYVVCFLSGMELTVACWCGSCCWLLVLVQVQVQVQVQVVLVVMIRGKASTLT